MRVLSARVTFLDFFCEADPTEEKGNEQNGRHDIVILRQYFAYCEKHPECLADKIEFETQRNVWGNLIDEAVAHLDKLHYVELRPGRDRATYVKEEPSYRQFGDFNLVVNN